MSIEKKYLFDNRLRKSAVHLAARLLDEDPEHPFSIVNSIYFDTYYENFKAEKADSDYLKHKVRLRWYQDDAGEPATGYFLEVKRKTGVRRNKDRWEVGDLVNGFGVPRLGSRQLAALNHRLRNETDGAIGRVFPVMQITYKRRRFQSSLNPERVNVDWDIKVVRPRFGGAHAAQVRRFPHAVLEVKGDSLTAGGPVTTLIRMLGCRKAAFSKFLVGYELTGDA
jgi:hypothetical protein